MRLRQGNWTSQRLRQESAAVLTVLIATRNRAQTLPAVLDAYCSLIEPPGGWKLLLVDNGSTDRTPEVIRAFSDRLPITLVRNQREGKNAALNAGLRFVEGDLVVFSDDDAFPRHDWLIRLREAADAQPGFDMFGGVVLPRWQHAPPSWLITAVPMGSTYTLSNPDLEEGPVDAGCLFGPNLAVRSRLFEAGYRFHPSIGPVASRWYPMGSETEFVLRLAREGAAAWWVESAVVEHFVRSEQLRTLWLLERGIRAGRGNRRMARLAGEADRLTVSRCLARLVRWTAQASLTVVTCDRRRLLEAWWSLSFVAGYTAEAIHEQLVAAHDDTGRTDDRGEVVYEPIHDQTLVVQRSGGGL
jgi:glycosyltransferase involved in cell wall biosynthesis